MHNIVSWLLLIGALSIHGTFGMGTISGSQIESTSHSVSVLLSSVQSSVQSVYQTTSMLEESVGLATSSLVVDLTSTNAISSTSIISTSPSPSTLSSSLIESSTVQPTPASSTNEITSSVLETTSALQAMSISSSMIESSPVQPVSTSSAIDTTSSLLVLEITSSSMPVSTSSVVESSTVQPISTSSAIETSSVLETTSTLQTLTSMVDSSIASVKLISSSIGVESTSSLSVSASSLVESSTIQPLSSSLVETSTVQLLPTSMIDSSVVQLESSSVTQTSSVKLVSTSSSMESSTLQPTPAIEATSVAESTPTLQDTSTFSVNSNSTAHFVSTSSMIESSTTQPILTSLAIESTSSLPVVETTSAVESASTSFVIETSPLASTVQTESSSTIPAVTPSATITSVSISASITTTGPIVITTPAPPLTIWELFLMFFNNLGVAEQAGFLIGVIVVILLLIVVLLFCCCCLCSRLRKKRQATQYSVRDSGFMVANQGASSMYANGGTRYLLRRDSSQRDPAHYELNQNQLDTDFEPPRTRETSVDNERLIDEHNGPSQAQPLRSQLSVAGDEVFQESTLPGLTPITSQLFNSSSLHQGLSVDDESPNNVPRRLSLGGDYRIPGASPSLRHPTRMGRAIENEDNKSAQGSHVSIPGSKTSIQGSRPSVFSSQTSFLQSGSRSQMFNPTLSGDQLAVVPTKPREEDTISLPLSGRTTSPIMNPSSLNSSIEVPTRDEPSNYNAQNKDFASMTSLPVTSALIAELQLGSIRVPMDLEPKPETGTKKSRRVSKDLSTLTTLKDSEPEKKEEAIPKEGSEKKKLKMSRLEMLTSLRASLRKTAKKVGLKSKSKQRDSVILTNDAAVSDQETTPTRESSVRRHSDQTVGSHDEPKSRPRAQSDFTHLSQPNLYYPPAPVYHQAKEIPQQQLSQSYGVPLMQVPVEDPFGRTRPPPEFTTRYPDMDTPDYSDLTTPDHAQYLPQHNDSTSDYPREFEGAGSPTISYASTDDRGASPHRFNERMGSPTYNGASKPLPTVRERYEFHDVPNSDMYTSPRRRATPDYMLATPMYPPPVPGYHPPMHNGYPMPPRGDYYHDRRPSFDNYGMDPMGTFHERRSSFDRTNPYHPRQGSYEAAPVEFRHYHPRRGSYDHDYPPSGRDRRHSGMSDQESSSDLSASRTRVSWNTEVIEYARTPSDGSDFDLNQL